MGELSATGSVRVLPIDDQGTGASTTAVLLERWHGFSSMHCLPFRIHWTTITGTNRFP